MERRWLVPLLIGGGALVLVALFVLFGGGSKTPEAIDAGEIADASTPIDTSAPQWMNATGAPTPTPTQAPDAPAIAPTTTASPTLDDAIAIHAASIDAAGPNATAPTTTTAGTPLIGGTNEQIAAVLQEHITELEKDIARKEAAGKHDEAEREKKALERLKGQLDLVRDGGPP